MNLLVDKPAFEIHWLTSRAVQLQWPKGIDIAQHEHILLVYRQLQQWFVGNAMSAAEAIVSYNSITVDLSRCTFARYHINTHLKRLSQQNQSISTPLNPHSHTSEQSIVDIPVFYDPRVAPDLHTICDEKQLSIDDIVQLHTGSNTIDASGHQNHTTYRAFAAGFAPGFTYLGEVAKPLQCARLATPRMRIPKGSVAIAEAQTAVYPAVSPGGWRIIGRTPIAMLNSNDNHLEPKLLPGDHARFYAISEAIYLELGGTFDE